VKYRDISCLILDKLRILRAVVAWAAEYRTWCGHWGHLRDRSAVTRPEVGMNHISSSSEKPQGEGVLSVREQESVRAGPQVCSAFTAFPAAAESIPAVRRWVRQQLWRWCVDADTSHCVELLVSELAANAFRHTTSAVLEVQLSIGPVLEGWVRDQDPSGLIQVCQPDVNDVGGRGLAIVAALSDDWGTHRDDTGKSVWFRLGPTVPEGLGPSPA
jgi:anti-sigma regulatory factor (Ser/Thr protein kinase)